MALGTRLRIVLKTAGTANISSLTMCASMRSAMTRIHLHRGHGLAPGGCALQRRGHRALRRVDGRCELPGVHNRRGYVGRVVNGPFVTVCFAAGGAGAQAKVRINGVQYEASGTSLVPGTTPIDVSAAVDLTAAGLDPANDHIVEVEVDAVKVRFEGLTVSTDNLISMRWDDKTLYEALHSIAKAVGGELVFDPAADRHPLAARGQDLKANNVVEFRRGLNIIRMTKRESRSKLVNRLTYIGYGEGQYMLRVTVDATGTNSDGDTSQDVYGVRRGIYINKECKNLATATAEAQRLVEESCWPQRSYDVQVTDEVADLLTPGDVGHFVYQNINENLRILEITRTTDGGPASLVVARTSDPLVDQIVAAGKQLATLQKSYQGVPSDANDSFSEQFERTSSGTDVAAVIPFFIPYGADLLDLRARYEVGGMRAYAKGAASQSSGASSKTTSDASSASTSGSPSTNTSGASSASTSGSPSTNTSGASSSHRFSTPTSKRGPFAPRDALLIRVTAHAPHERPTHAVGGATVRNHRYVRPHLLWYATTATPGLSVFLAQQCWAESVTHHRWQRSRIKIVFRVTAGVGPHAVPVCELNGLCLAPREPAHGMDHTHSLASHTHGMDHTHSLASHTHGMAHTHGMDHNHGSHTHNLVYGIYESAVPATVRVYLDGTLITALNDLRLVSDFDLLPYVTKDSNGRVAEGWHTLEFTSATAGATGSVRGCLFQRKFISTEAA